MTAYLYRIKYREMHTFFRSNRKKVTRIDKKGKGITEILPCKLQFIVTTGFMISSLLTLVNNLAERIHNERIHV